MKKLLVICLCAMSVNASALLSPLWQGVTEMEDILNSQEIGDYFSSGEEIIEISKDGQVYRLQGTISSCFVEVTYLPQSMPGPAKFSLKFVRE